jgi:hypothetical protein
MDRCPSGGLALDVSYMEDDTMWPYVSDRGTVADVCACAMGSSRGES